MCKVQRPALRLTIKESKSNPRPTRKPGPRSICTYGLFPGVCYCFAFVLKVSEAMFCDGMDYHEATERCCTTQASSMHRAIIFSGAPATLMKYMKSPQPSKRTRAGGLHLTAFQDSSMVSFQATIPNTNTYNLFST